jgi:antitoxin (DNA-binding transcriptional repressor) of toxin-antitoxin stability system
MGVMSIREFNSNVSKAIARVEAGETLDITRNGRVIVELRPKSKSRREDARWRAAFESLMEDVEKGVPFQRTFDHDERNS